MFCADRVAEYRLRIRAIPLAVHSREDLDLGIGAFAKVERELGMLS